MATRALDTVITFRVLKLLTTAWEDQAAFATGLIDDKGKRILFIMPGSSKDVFMSTSLFKSIKDKYPDYNLYVSTKPEYFRIIEGSEYVHKVIPYNPQFDNSLYLEGVGKQKGFFEIAFIPYLTTQRVNNYIHNSKDIIDQKRLCTF